MEKHRETREQAATQEEIVESSEYRQEIFLVGHDRTFWCRVVIAGSLSRVSRVRAGVGR